jgi:hypothetical protein
LYLFFKASPHIERIGGNAGIKVGEDKDVLSPILQGLTEFGGDAESPLLVDGVREPSDESHADALYAHFIPFPSISSHLDRKNIYPNPLCQEKSIPSDKFSVVAGRALYFGGRRN